LVAAPMPEHEHGHRSHERVGDKQNERHVTRKLEPFKTGAIAEEIAPTLSARDIPQRSARDEQQWKSPIPSYTTCHQPDAVPIPAIEASHKP